MEQSPIPRSNTAGFSPVILIATIVLIGALVGGGWYVMNKQDSKSRSSNQSNSQSNGKKSTDKDDPEKITDPTEGGKYLVIKEWGVRFPLPESMKGDVTYAIRNESAEIQTAFLEVGKIASLPDSQCQLGDLTGEYRGIGSLLTRSTRELTADESRWYYSPSVNRKVGNYWFSGAYEKMADLCVPEDSQGLAGEMGNQITHALDKVATAP